MTHDQSYPEKDLPPVEALNEGIDVLVNLIESIRKHGNYSAESTVTFMDQALQSFREALRGLSPAAQGTGVPPSLPKGWTQDHAAKASWMINTLMITPTDEWRSKTEIHRELNALFAYPIPDQGR